MNGKLSITNYIFQISKDVIASLPDKMMTQQNIFEHTGGLHACALFTKDGALLLLREDAGKHIAMDKLVGGHQYGN